MHYHPHHRIGLFRIFSRDMRTLPRVVVLSIISISIYNFGWGFADPFFSLFLAGFSDSYALIGFFTTILNATSLLLIIPLGALLDHIRHATMINAGKVIVVIIAVLYFLAGHFSSTPLLVTALFLNGCTYALVWPSTIATIRTYSGSTHAALGLGLFFTFRQLSWAAGLGVALFFVWHFPIYYIFIPTMLTPLVSMLFSGKKNERSGETLPQAIKAVLFKEKLVLRFVNEIKQWNIQMWWAYGTFMGIYVLYLLAVVFIPLFAQSLGWSLFDIGLLVIAMNIPFILSFFAAEWADHVSRVRVVIIGVSVAIVGALLLAMWNDAMWQIFVGGSILVLGYSIASPALSSVITMLTPTGYAGTTTSLLEFCLQLSMVIFSPLIGLLIDARGWETVFGCVAIFCASIAIVSSGALIFFQKRNRAAAQKNGHTQLPYVL